MMTVKELSILSGVSIRTLHHYDDIGLLRPSSYTESGYRLYDEQALERLHQILFYRELEFPLKDIREILDAENFDRNAALEQQITLLTLKKEHLENLISLARGIRLCGWERLDFKVFDTRKIDEYTRQAKEQWGNTPAYAEFEQKNKGRSKADQQSLNKDLMQIFVKLGGMMHLPAEDPAVQAQIKKLQDFITAHFYTCTNEILFGLGQMYGCDGEFTENIDSAAGAGCGAFAQKAIGIYCKSFTKLNFGE